MAAAGSRRSSPNDDSRLRTVAGWVATRREHGQALAFVDVRDHTGVTQCVVDNTVDVRPEYVVRVTGVVAARPDENVNPRLPTGEIEIQNCQVEVLNVNLEATSDRFEIGDLTRTDVAQSQARLALAQGDARNAEANLITARENYIALVGSSPDDLQPPPPLPGLPETAAQAAKPMGCTAFLKWPKIEVKAGESKTIIISNNQIQTP